ncbi:FAD-binding domain-containing protein [Mollisia scopiformis]|uniref:FAD-binding domain-containing protein n=1 Tax=Mollisia scopiformis TaxID=149040 RepID=A0A132B961_MOLSC|nr:FAD-binding domain-containing protein [Mollisia scopiformis]KUJ08911.1 FAD-binding domain-containing protein [Mollisia scopiformis]
MGSSQSTLDRSIKRALGKDRDLYAFPGNPFYALRDVKLYNQTYPVKPAAVVYPKTAAQVAAVIKCAVDAGRKVQARSGGHSYANYCLGGIDGAVVIDLKHFQHFSMDPETFIATAGGGTLLGNLTKKMHDAGHRAMAHGTCPQVGLGGHATIGGLGPSSRLWGAALDHIEEIEVVLADSSIKRASATQNSDIFWAVKGAGASFGVVTEFVLRTEKEPGEAVHFSYSFTIGTYASMGVVFKAWQKFVANPSLSRKFASEAIITEVGLIISGTYYGSKKEYDALEMDDRFPGHQKAKTIVFRDWLGLVAHWGEEVALLLGGGLSGPLYTKSMTFNGCDLIPDSVIDSLFSYLDQVEKGTLIWFIIFDLAGGAVNDIAQDATAYAHRDALFYLQSYAVGVGKVAEKTKNFLRGVNTLLKDGTPGGDEFGAYAGYVDPELPDGPLAYWRTNLPRLEQIKSMVDPDDVFHNPQSVEPAGSRETPSPNGVLKKAKPKSRKRIFCF